MKTNITNPTLQSVVSSIWTALPQFVIISALFVVFLFSTASGAIEGGLVGLLCLSSVTVLCALNLIFPNDHKKKIIRQSLISAMPALVICVVSLILNDVTISGSIDVGRVALVLFAPWAFGLAKHTHKSIENYSNQIAVIGLFLFVGWLTNWMPSEDRLEFLGMHKQKSGAILTSMFIVCLAVNRTSLVSKTINTVGIITIFTMILFTDSQLAQLISLLVIGIFIASKTGFWLKQTPQLVFGANAILVLFLPVLIFTIFSLGFQDIFKTLTSSRTHIWFTILQSWLDGSALQVLLGYGPSAGDSGLYHGHTEHNAFLAVLYRMGAIGLLCYLWWFWKLVQQTCGISKSKTTKVAMSMVVITMCIQGLLATTIPFGLVLGYVILLPILSLDISKN